MKGWHLSLHGLILKSILSTKTKYDIDAAQAKHSKMILDPLTVYKFHIRAFLVSTGFESLSRYTWAECYRVHWILDVEDS